MATTPTSGIYATPLPIQRSSGLHESRVRWDDTPTRSLDTTRWISPSLLCHTGTSTPIGKSHRNAVHPVYTPLLKIHNLSLPTHTHFLYKINRIMGIVLSVLISINVQAKSDINIGSQGMVITNQGVAIQPCFHTSKTYAILLNRPLGCVYKN